jgi:hypothetical protein
MKFKDGDTVVCENAYGKYNITKNKTYSLKSYNGNDSFLRHHLVFYDDEGYPQRISDYQNSFKIYSPIDDKLKFLEKATEIVREIKQLQENTYAPARYIEFSNPSFAMKNSFYLDTPELQNLAKDMMISLRDRRIQQLNDKLKELGMPEV